MRLQVLSETYLILVCGITFLPVVFTVSNARDKRTLDLVLRSVADAFGYDIQKRPSVLAVPTTTPTPQASTFFPPPVAPLPPAPKPVLFPLVPRATLPPPEVAPPLKPPVLVIKPPIPTPKALLPIPRAPTPRALPPKAPPPKAPAPPPPPPPKAPPPAPPKQPAPLPTLTETIRKTFNLNFNWNKNVQPGGPAPAPPAKPPAGPAPAPPAPGKPPIAPAAPPPPPPPQPAPAAAQPVAPAVPAAARPSPGGQVYIKKPQLYQDYDYTNGNQKVPQELYDYPDYQNQYLNQDYAETNKEFDKKANENEQEQAKERFKESVSAFWKNYPLTEQKGYKYIAPSRKPPEEKAQFSQSFPKDGSKYEEYDIVQVQTKETDNAPQHHNCPPQQAYIASVRKNPEAEQQVEQPKDVENVPRTNSAPDYDDQPTYIYLLPKEYADYYDEPQSQHQNQDEENPDYADSAIHSVKQPQAANQQQKYERRSGKQNRTQIQNESGTIAHPLYSGILPASLHHLARSESQNKEWSVPYDYDIEGTENKNKYVKKQNSSPSSNIKMDADGIYHYECCEKQNTGSDFDFYTVPEPKRVDYSKYEQLHVDEDDGGLSKNARIQTKEKKVTILKANAYETPVKL